eukprot:scaffold72363_cov60-Phaeocystis_antarctica.AAC.7
MGLEVAFGQKKPAATARRWAKVRVKIGASGRVRARGEGEGKEWGISHQGSYRYNQDSIVRRASYRRTALLNNLSDSRSSTSRGRSRHRRPAPARSARAGPVAHRSTLSLGPDDLGLVAENQHRGVLNVDGAAALRPARGRVELKEGVVHTNIAARDQQGAAPRRLVAAQYATVQRETSGVHFNGAARVVLEQCILEHSVTVADP